MNLGPRFWRTVDPPTLMAYPAGWVERGGADRRGVRAMALGSIAYHDIRYAVLVGMIKSNVIAKRIRVPSVVLTGPWQIN